MMTDSRAFTGTARSFLMLQGVNSPFFHRLAQALLKAGYNVIKINFTVGDRWYYWASPTLSFRGDVAALPEFLQQVYQQHHITDQILFGDQRPIHRCAIAQARSLQIRNFVFEEGYFRPSYVTLESEGVNAASMMPRDRNWYVLAARCLAKTNTAMTRERTVFSNPFWVRALHDVIYHCGNFWNFLCYPAYRSHSIWRAPIEYAGYSWRLPMLAYWEKRELTLWSRLRQQSAWFLLPLQLASDAQIRYHSKFGDVKQVITTVIANFAAHAAPHHQLVIKNHPLDIGWARYRRYVEQESTKFGVAARVHYVETGDLAELLSACAGVITVNSTVGLQALQSGCPVICLGDAIYDFAGLTHQHTLDDFWLHATAPEPALVQAFVQVLQHCTQLTGSLYAEPGLSVLVQASVQILQQPISRLETLCQHITQHEF